MKNGKFHPCTCTDYNGGQCYNCLNGAHDICEAKKKCGAKRSKQVGLMIIEKNARTVSKWPKWKRDIVITAETAASGNFYPKKIQKRVKRNKGKRKIDLSFEVCAYLIDVIRYFNEVYMKKKRSQPRSTVREIR